MASIKLGNKEIPLKMTVIAMKNIEKQIGGDLSTIDKFIQKGTTTDKLINVIGIIRHMANGYVAKHNVDIDFGLVEGEKLKFYDEEMFLNAFEISDFNQLNDALYATMSGDTQYTVPDNVKLKQNDEVDEVLEEINQAKNE